MRTHQNVQPKEPQPAELSVEEREREGGARGVTKLGQLSAQTGDAERVEQRSAVFTQTSQHKDDCLAVYSEVNEGLGPRNRGRWTIKHNRPTIWVDSQDVQDDKQDE